MRNPRHILITGASSGIGTALARRYAGAGTTLDLAGRDVVRLEAVAEACRAAGAETFTRRLDVSDRVAVEDWLARADARGAVELVIANAGISGGTGGVRGEDGLAESRAQMDAILDANVQGLVNTVTPALRAMSARKRGQVALMSSIASFRGFPGAPAYCASKAWVRVWAEGLRPEYAARGVQVSVICPGYVRSPMTDRNDFPMPFLVEVERAADIIVGGLARNRARIVFPRRLYWLLRLYAALPEPLLDVVMQRLPRKGAGAR